jgi:hypothetical protein
MNGTNKEIARKIWKAAILNVLELNTEINELYEKIRKNQESFGLDSLMKVYDRF